jgi:hypothetical protein
MTGGAFEEGNVQSLEAYRARKQQKLPEDLREVNS